MMVKNHNTDTPQITKKVSQYTDSDGWIFCKNTLPNPNFVFTPKAK